MRFCMVTTFYPPYHFGGDALFVKALAGALAREGHEVDVVHCEDAYRLRGRKAREPSVEEAGVVVHRLRSPFGALSPLITQQTGRPGLKAAHLRSVLAHDFDVVNFHNISLIGGPAVLAMSRAEVTLYTLHEHWLLCPTHIFWKNRRQACDRPQCLRCCLRSGVPPQIWRLTGLIRRSLSGVDALLAPSRFTAKRHQVAGLPEPVVLPTFSGLEPEDGGERTIAERPRFLFVGRLTASKGIEFLVREFADLPGLELLVIGDGDLREPLQARYAGNPNICFRGPVPQADLVGVYRDSIALILPSLAPEVFPLTVLEALACGTPVVVHDAGGSGEAVEKTGGGSVYRSPEELRSILETLARDPALRETLSRRARAGYLRFYSQERYLSSYLDIIDAIRDKKRSGAAPQ